MKRDIFFETEIEFIDERGYGRGLAIINDTKYNAFVLDALVGEKVKAHAYNKKRGDIFGTTIEWINKNPDRIEACCKEHFLACSPLQNYKLEKQLEFKKNLIINSFNKFAEIKIDDLEITESTKDYYYRNKVEFGFYQDWDNGLVSLSYFKRGGSKGRYSIQKCHLLNDKMNKIGEIIIKIINKYQISSKVLKYLLVRYSNYEDNISVDLFVNDKEFFGENYDFGIFDEIISLSWVKGFRVIYSNPLSPASRNDGILFNFGTDLLKEKVLDTVLEFDTNSFFQVNVSTFELLMSNLKEVISKNDTSYNLRNKTLIDLYCGVGTIGLILRDHFKGIIGVENSLNSKKLAMNNATRNNALNTKFIETDAKNAIDFIENDKIVLMDPPRSGVGIEVIERLKSQKPDIIIYISCNPVTLAKNINQLKDLYKIIFIKAYDFYPHTPHVETTCVLKLI